MQGSEQVSPSGCVRHRYASVDDYMAKMRAQGLECRIVEQSEGAEGVPDGCDANGIERTLLVMCNAAANGTGAADGGRAAYAVGNGNVVEFTAPDGNPGGIHIAVSEHCHYLVFPDPEGYAGRQEKAGFECARVNESADIYGITPVCKEFMSGEAQRDAGLELTRTIYFNCTLPDGKANIFPVYQTANGSYAFFGELK